MNAALWNPRRSPAVAIALLLGGLTLFRLWFCTTLDLLPDEAYYFLWSKHLDASYYSKGPGVGWTIALGTALAGDTVFGVRWIAVLLAAGTGWQLWRLGQRLFGETTATRAVLVALAMPLLAVGGVLMTIDPLCVFFWVLGANLFWVAVASTDETPRTVAMRRWLGVGLVLGLGFLCKFVSALQWLAFVLFLLTDPARRKWLVRGEFWAAVGVFALCTLPVFYWNAKHGWITATHLKERGKLESSFGFHPGEFGDFFFQQALVWSPLLFAGMLGVAVEGLCRWKKMDAARRYALCLFWTVFGFYLVLATNNKGEANWTATALIGGVLLLVRRAQELSSRSSFWRGVGLTAWTLGLVMTVAMHSTGLLPFPPKLDPLNRARGWRQLAEQVEPHVAAHPNAPIVGNKYQTCSVLTFYLPGRPTTYMPPSDHIQNQFSFWPTFDPERTDEILFVTDEIKWTPEQCEPGLVRRYPVQERLADIPIAPRGREIRRFHVYRLAKR